VLASQFDDDQLVIISDVSVKTTYFTLLNLTENQLPPLTPEVRPLSNLSLALDKCQSLIQVTGIRTLLYSLSFFSLYNNELQQSSVGNLGPAMGARNQVGIGLSYRPASLCSFATQFQTRFLESIPFQHSGT
jgi:hypothetical protein